MKRTNRFFFFNFCQILSYELGCDFSSVKVCVVSNCFFVLSFCVFACVCVAWQTPEQFSVFGTNHAIHVKKRQTVTSATLLHS